MPPSDLTQELRAAVAQRERALRNGWSRRNDIDAVRASIGKAHVYLNSYPHADDARTLEWCRTNIDHVCRIVPSNQFRRLARLIQSELKPNKKKAA